MATAYSLVNQTKQAILDTLTAQQGPGGTLSTVLSIGPTGYPEAGVYPYIGVELIHREEKVMANGRRDSCCHWGMNVSVKSTTLLRDAIAARDLIVDDGLGNGVEPLIRAMATNRLNGLVYKSEIQNVTFLTNIEVDKSAAATGYFADALIMFSTYQQIDA